MRLRFTGAFCLLMVFCSPRPCAADCTIRTIAADSLQPEFLLQSEARWTQLPPAPETWLSLHLVQGGDTAALAVAADYTLRNGQLCMTPRIVLSPGNRFALRWHCEPGAPMAAGYETPVYQPSGTAAALATVYPSGDTLPANLLFFHLRFTGPMRPDEEAYQHIRIRKSGDATALPFAWRQRSYWQDSNRLLLLMVHPGRVKRGIDYGGPLLEPGSSYVLTLDSSLLDDSGRPLAGAVLKKFVAGAEDRTIPHLDHLEAGVTARSRAPLRVCFSEAMDVAGTQEGLSVQDAGGHAVPVRVVPEATQGCRCFDLMPERPWKPGRYELLCSRAVTDLAANTLRRQFEMVHIREAAKDAMPVRRVFRVR